MFNIHPQICDSMFDLLASFRALRPPNRLNIRFTAFQVFLDLKSMFGDDSIHPIKKQNLLNRVECSLTKESLINLDSHSTTPKPRLNPYQNADREISTLNGSIAVATLNGRQTQFGEAG